MSMGCGAHGRKADITAGFLHGRIAGQSGLGRNVVNGRFQLVALQLEYLIGTLAQCTQLPLERMRNARTPGNKTRAAAMRSSPKVIGRSQMKETPP